MQKLNYLYPNVDPIPPILATKTDSIIRHMQYQIDSLAKHTQVNEIGQNFFSDAISRDLYMFSTMIVIVGLISWGFIVGVLAYHKRKVRQDTTKQLSEALTSINDRISGIERRASILRLDTCRSMYFINEGLNKSAMAFVWGISVLRSIQRYQQYSNDDRKKDYLNWLNNCKTKLEQCEIRNSHLIEKSKTVIKSLESLAKIEDEEIQKATNSIEEKFKHLVSRHFDIVV